MKNRQFQIAQRGAVLIVALIMLLLLTIIGLSGMRGTTLQENMTSNMREGNLSFQAAEAALRRGEEEALAMFLGNNIYQLEVDDVDGTYPDFAGVAQDPGYTIALLAKLRTSTEVGVPIDDEGVLVRVESSGYGATLRGDNDPAARSDLRSTFLMEQ